MDYNSHNFYNNDSFHNSNNWPFQSDPLEPYIDPAMIDFMHEQGKMNMMIFEQMQQLTAQSKLLMDQNKMILEQLAKRQLCKGYESLVKNCTDFLSELQEETGVVKSICAANVHTDDLEGRE